MSDPIHNRAAELDSPAWDAWEISPSDENQIPTPPCRFIYVGGAGSLTVDMAAGRSVTFAAVPAGTTLAIRVDQVFATGTTATSIVALY